MPGGYCDCACADCFDVAVTSTDERALCHACVEAGCTVEVEGEPHVDCQRNDAYGCDESDPNEPEPKLNTKPEGESWNGE